MRPTIIGALGQGEVPCQAAHAEVDLVSSLHWPNPHVPLAETIGALAHASGSVFRPGTSGFQNFTVALGKDKSLSGAAGLRSGRIPSLSRSGEGEGSLREQTAWTLVAYVPLPRAGQERRGPGADRPGPYRKSAAQSACAGLSNRRLGDPAHLAHRAAVGKYRHFRFRASDEEMEQIFQLATPGGRMTDFGFAPKWD